MLRMLAMEEISVGQLAERFPVSRPAVSKHLRVLEAAGMVVRETRGNCNYCKLDTRGFDAARRWLDEFWEDALGRFALVAENTSEQNRRTTPAPRRQAKKVPRSKKRG
jgi:DNA-binding transcriptional ArsR family regulator